MPNLKMNEVPEVLKKACVKTKLKLPYEVEMDLSLDQINDFPPQLWVHTESQKSSLPDERSILITFESMNSFADFIATLNQMAASIAKQKIAMQKS